MRWLNNVSFKYKLTIPITVIILSFTFLIVQVSVVFSEQHKVNKVLNEQVQPVLDEMEDAYRDIYQVMTAGMGMALTLPDDKEMIEFHKFNFYDNAPKAAPRIASPHQLVDIGFLPEASRNNIIQLENKYDVWQKRYEFIVTHPEQALDYYRDHEDIAEKDFEEIRGLIKVIRGEIIDTREKLIQEVAEHSEAAQTILLTGSGITIVVSLVIAFVMTRLVVNPLHQLTDSLKAISDGDGDLTARVPVMGQDETGQLATAYNTFVGKIQATLAKVVASSDLLQREAAYLSSLTANIVSSCHVQQHECQAVESAVSELSATSHAVSDHAAEAANATQAFNQQSGTMQLTLADSVAAMEQLSAEINESSLMMQELEKNVVDISSILEVIRGIADQTNLLALNAAIEAARAGDQGRGFAVVADEVRALASKTQNCTNEIHGMIETLKGTAERSVQVMRSNAKAGADTVARSQETNVALDVMNQSIVMISDMNTQVAAAAEQQTAVTGSLTENIHAIVMGCNDTLSHIESAQKVCDALAAQSTELDSLMGQFKV